MDERKNNKARYAIILVWSIFLLLSVVYYIKAMMPTIRYYTINNPYTMDSVWNAEENTWHNDVLLNTIFSGKTVYISPISWYANYVNAFAEKTMFDNTMSEFVDEENLDQYVCMNNILAIQNSTLFNADIVNYISENAKEGAAYLYIAEESCASSNAIDVYHDKIGNLYLKGHENE